MQNTIKSPAIHPICATIPDLPADDMTALTESVLAKGLRRPITLYQGQILDGRHRYAACRAAGVEPRYAEFTGDDTAAKAFVLEENVLSHNLSESQRALVLTLMGDIQPQGGLRLSQEDSTQNRNSDFALTQPNSTPVREIAARGNVSRDTISKANQVKRDDDPALIAAVLDGRVTANDAYAEVKRVAAAPDKDKALAQRKEALDEQSEKGGTIAKVTRRIEQKQRQAELAAADAPIPTGRYDVILADPPWRYEFSATTSRAIESHYPSMALDEICALPISDLAADDAVLYLWATAPKLREALAVMDAWGFEYKSNMVWVKRSIGMGYWARGRHEHLLIGVKGAFPAPPPDERPDSVIEAPRREHSQKPDEAYELLERLYPNMARLELFARNARFDWQAWGNEAYANK